MGIPIRMGADGTLRGSTTGLMRPPRQSRLFVCVSAQARTLPRPLVQVNWHRCASPVSSPATLFDAVLRCPIVFESAADKGDIWPMWGVVPWDCWPVPCPSGGAGLRAMVARHWGILPALGLPAPPVRQHLPQCVLSPSAPFVQDSVPRALSPESDTAFHRARPLVAADLGRVLEGRVAQVRVRARVQAARPRSLLGNGRLLFHAQQRLMRRHRPAGHEALRSLAKQRAEGD